MFKPYRELKDYEKFQVGKMYTGNLDNYLYDFDDKGFHGRKPISEQDNPISNIKDEVKEVQAKIGKVAKEVVRRTRKK